MSVVLLVLVGAWVLLGSSSGGRNGLALSGTLPTDLDPAALVVPPAPAEFGDYAFLAEDDGKPVRWNPCRTIHYRVRPGPGPSNAVELVRESFDEVTRRTGLTFVYDGLTDEVPQQHDSFVDLPAGSMVIDPVVVAFADSKESDLWEGASSSLGGGSVSAGFGGPEMIQRGNRREYVSGMVLIRADIGLTPNPSGPSSYGAVLLHEMGHLVGLAHVEESRELMQPVLGIQGGFGYGPGDQRGLWLLGAAGGC